MAPETYILVFAPIYKPLQNFKVSSLTKDLTKILHIFYLICFKCRKKIMVCKINSKNGIFNDFLSFYERNIQHFYSIFESKTF